MAESALERANRLRRRAGLIQQTPAPQRDTSYRRHPAVVQSRGNRGRSGGPNIPSSVTNAVKGIGGSRGFSSSPERQKFAFDRAMDQLVSDYAQNVQKQQIVNRVAGQDGGEEAEPGIFGKIMGGIGSSPIGNMLYQAGRLPNAWFQGLENLSNRDTSVDRGFWQEGGDIFKTLGQGFGSGWNYSGDPGPGGNEDPVSGFGEVYEGLKENPNSLVHKPLQAFEEAHPNWEQALAIGVGATGEFALDPYNVLAPAAPAVLRATGQRLTRAALDETLDLATREALNNALSANPSLFNRSPHSPDMIHARAQSTIDDALNQTLLNVTGGGAPHARTIGGAALPSTVSQKWAQSVIDSISGQADQAVQKVINDPNSMTVGNINARRAVSKDFDDFWNDLTTALKNDPHYGPAMSGGVDEVIAILQGNANTLGRSNSVVGGIIANSWEKVRNAHFVELQPHVDELYKAVENPTTRTLGLRIGRKGRKSVVQVPVVGRAFAKASDQIAKIPGAQGIGSFLYERQFPAIFANKISRASAYGVRGLDTFMKDLEHVAKGMGGRAFSKAEAEDLFKYLGDHTFHYGDKRMDDALDWLRTKRDERFFDELREGARSVDSVDKNGVVTNLTHKAHDPNYQYLHLKGGTKNKRTQFLEERAQQYKTYGNYIGYTVDDAKKWGLRPIDNAFEAMQLHYMDSANKITNAYLWHDIAANYGIMNNATVTGISDLERAARGLKQIEYGKLSTAFKQMVKDTNGKFYVPSEIYGFGKNVDKMMDWSTSKMGRFGRSFAKVINAYKQWITLPYLGFHMRNFAGDTMMGMLDGVSPTKYTEVMRKYLASKRGLASNFQIIPGVDMSFQALLKQFRDEANGSYLKMDIGLTNTKTVGKIAGVGRSAGKVLRNVADDRELLPRFTHYVHALREESRALWNSGMRDTDAIMQQSKDAALWRVNHYKFDYNALLPWERQLKATVFPFYTYTRKAIPTLMEQMFINPHYFQMVNRFQMSNDGSAADAFNYMNVPQFWRDFGYSMATDENEPLGLTGEIFPTAALDIISSNSLNEVAGDVISMANPFVQAPYELRSGKRAFDDREIEGGIFDYAMSKVPLIGDLQERFSNLPGVPGESPYPVTGGEGWSWDKFISDRMLGGGVPLRRATEPQQAQQMEANFDIAVDRPLEEYNYSQDRFTIQLQQETGGFVIRDKYTGELVPGSSVFPTPQEAIAWAISRLPSPKHDVPPLVNQAPTGQDYARLRASQ